MAFLLIDINVIIIVTQLYFCLQIFFAVVLYGLFHGLVFLPVLLSLLGPAPYPKEVGAEDSADDEASHPFTSQKKSEEQNEEQDHSSNLLNKDIALENNTKNGKCKETSLRMSANSNNESSLCEGEPSTQVVNSCT